MLSVDLGKRGCNAGSIQHLLLATVFCSLTFSFLSSLPFELSILNFSIDLMLKMLFNLLSVAGFAATVLAHDSHDQKPIAGPHKSLWYNTRNAIPGDGGTQVCLFFRLLRKQSTEKP